MDTLFLLDIGLNFRTGFYDEAGLLVMERARITRRYLRSWFALDAASSVPMQAIALVLASSGVTGGGSLVAVKLVRRTSLCATLRRPCAAPALTRCCAPLRRCGC